MTIESLNGANSISLNAQVMRSIELMFPEHRKPDEENFLPNGDQYKAPDYAVLGGKVAIELKSRKPNERNAIYGKAFDIAASQGKAFGAFGRLNLNRIISELPDPIGAERTLKDYIMSQTLKSIKSTREKFENYDSCQGHGRATRILVYSDDSGFVGQNDWIEHFLGRKMGGYSSDADVMNHIDAVFHVQNPELIWDAVNSYWFKCLVKKRLEAADRDLTIKIAKQLHDLVLKSGFAGLEGSQLKLGRFRALLV